MAKHVYEVHLNDGRSYQVDADHHHDDHPPDAFQTYLIDLVKRLIGDVISHGLVHKVIYKGRRP